MKSFTDTDRGYTLGHMQEQALSPVVNKIRVSIDRSIEEDRVRSSHPRSAKDVPFLDFEVFSKTFNIFHQIPGRVILQGRTPTPSPNGSIALLK